MELSYQQLLHLLRYSGSNFRQVTDDHPPETAHFFRAAARANVKGAYVFNTSADRLLPARPAVFVAEAHTEAQARLIHRSLWNLGNAPFLIVLLPHQIRVYTGFDYDEHDEKRGFIEAVLFAEKLLDEVVEEISHKLEGLTAVAVDTGEIWKRYGQQLDPERRVDRRLLKNLTNLEEILGERLTSLEADALPIAHALIGKYVYIRYLNDSGILSPQWLEEEGIDLDLVLGVNATVAGLLALTKALEIRFNGKIFPFPENAVDKLSDEVIALVAGAFKGDDPLLRQRHLDFEPYDFSYIPVELLSAIYEQFLRSQGKGKASGAIYTPEPLADYLLSEVESVKPLHAFTTVLDPCCGSGIFLVLVYRRMIEKALAADPRHKLVPTELRKILMSNIYGVERNLDACYVTEFSLILTMLSYIKPPDLHRNKRFKFPDLHNKRIFKCDFFDDDSDFWRKRLKFEWIVGNPPWNELKPDSVEEGHVRRWIIKNRTERPVTGNKVVEAFTWRVMDVAANDLLVGKGCIGLITHASSLFNYESKPYRVAFFKQHEVSRVSNFSNLAYVLFGGRGEAPASTVVYAQSSGEPKSEILHYGPFAANQLFNPRRKRSRRNVTWTITVNETEVTMIAHQEAEKGESLTWKLALWGHHRDKRALRQIQRLFSSTVGLLAQEKQWNLHQGLALKDITKVPPKKVKKYEHMPVLEGQNRLSARKMINSHYRLRVPGEARVKILANEAYIRLRGGKAGLLIAPKPHLVLNPSYCAFDDEYCIVPHPQVGIAGPDEQYLQALSLLINSSVLQYYLFFLSPSWGVDRNKIYPQDVKEIPLPILSPSQISELASVHTLLAEEERAYSGFTDEIQKVIDQKLGEILAVPEHLLTMARDFICNRLPLNKGHFVTDATRNVTSDELMAYGEMLRDELDTFTEFDGTRHKISFLFSDVLVVCSIEIVDGRTAHEPVISTIDGPFPALLTQLPEKLKDQPSQWVYVQRSLRIFEKTKAHICKTSRLLDWTKTQALLDSDDIIAEVLSNRTQNNKAKVNELTTA